MTEPLYDWPTICSMVTRMRDNQSPMFERMRDVLVRYDGDYVVPMINMDNEPKMPQLAPALVGEAIDQIALRAASTEPTVNCPPVKFNALTGRGSRDWAARRVFSIHAAYEQSRWKLGRRRYYRHLTAYHTAAICVTPDFRSGMPRIDTRDPLCALTEPQAADSVRDPEYTAFINQFSGAFLRSRWEHLKQENGGPITRFDDTRLWEICEWYDNQDVVYGLLGPVDSIGNHIASDLSRYTSMAIGGTSGTDSMPSPTMEIARFPNKLGFPPCVMPHNVSLGRIASRIGSLLGNIDLQTKLMALYVVAQERGVFPDLVIIGDNGQEPQVTSGDWKDGRSGEANTVKNASDVRVLRSAPDPGTGLMVDRLERNFRSSTQLLPQFGGETYGALRTGRGIDALSGMALDPRIQELHEISEAYLVRMNQAILGTYRAYFGAKNYSMYCGYRGARKLVEFTPEVHIENNENSVSYYMAGGDLMQVTQMLGSLLGAGIISQRTMAEHHPFVPDADDEASQILTEKLKQAIVEGLQQQIVAGTLPIAILAKVGVMLREEKDLFDIIKKIDDELRELQATPAGPAPEGMIASPGTMPGLTGGPAADQQPVPPTPVATPPGTTAVRELLGAMAPAAGG